MASIVFACVSPHPPIIVHEIGLGRERGTQKTIDALEQVAREMAQHQPETAILISPHGPAQPDAFTILVGPRADGSLDAWDAPQVTFAFENDVEAASLIREEAQRAECPWSPSSAGDTATPQAAGATGWTGAAPFPSITCGRAWQKPSWCPCAYPTCRHSSTSLWGRPSPERPNAWTSEW